jgi:predicted transcriptional regulator
VLGTKVKRQDEKDEEVRANLKVVEGQLVSQAQYAIWAAMPQGKWIDAAKLSSKMKEYNHTTTGRIMQDLYEKGLLQRKHDVPPYYRRKAH